MINTVLGTIDAKDLGVTLMHEHIFWDWNGGEEDSRNKYDKDDAVSTMVPYLRELKELGCQTFVEASTYGSGRNIEVLRECAQKTGLNIITNCGMWDGGEFHGKLIPKELRSLEIDEISDLWTSEYTEGIEGTDIRPGFIKLALGDEGIISELQERMLRAAVRTSLRTGLVIECHIGHSTSARRAVEIIQEEGLPFNKFIWLHIDWSEDIPTILELGKKGIWLEIDAISVMKEPYEVQMRILKKLIEEDLIDRTLISQDAGCYEAGGAKDKNLRTYNNIFTKFLPLCKEEGIDDWIINKILIENPAKALNID